jgi:hypothetical protein
MQMLLTILNPADHASAERVLFYDTMDILDS